MAKLKPTAELSNISGMSGLETTKAVQSVTNAFGLLEDAEGSAEKATKRYGDVITSVSKGMAYDFAGGIQELNNAITAGGSSAKEAGMSLEQYTSFMGALIEQTGRSGSELSRAFNTIIARTTQVKSISEELGVTTAEMGDAEKALNSIGLTAKGQVEGSFKNVGDILQEVSAKWGELTDQEKQYVAEKLAGNRQRSVFISLMKSMTKEQELYNSAMNSNGVLEEANEVKAKSLEGRLNTLNDSVKQLYSSLMNSESIKSGISILTSFVDAVQTVTSKLGAIPTVLTTVSTSFSIFSTKFRNTFTNITNGIPIIGNFSKSLDNTTIKLKATQLEQQRQIASLQALKTQYTLAGLSTNTLNSSLTKVQSQLAVTTIKMTACKVATIAFQSALSMGLSIVIGKAIEGIDNLIHAHEKLKESNENSISSFNTSQESISNSTQLLAEKKKLELEISNNNGNSEKQLELKSKLVDVERELAKELPNSISGYDEQGKAISTNNKLIQEQLELKKAQIISDSYKGLKNNIGLFNGQTNEFEEAVDNYNKMIVARDKLQQKLDTFDYDENTKNGGFSGQLKEDTTQLKLLNANITENNEVISQRRVQILQLLEAGQSYTQISSQLGISEEVLRKYTNELGNAGDKSLELSKKIELINTAIGELDKNYISYNTIKQLKDVFPELGINLDNAKEKIKELQKQLADGSPIIKEAEEEILNSGKLSKETIDRLAKAFPTLGVNADNAEYLLSSFGVSLDDISDKTKDAKTELENLTNAFNELNGSIDIIDKVKDEMEQYDGAITNSTMATLIEKYPEVLQALTSEGDAVENLNKLQSEQISKLEETKDKSIQASIDKMNADKVQAEASENSSDEKTQNEIDNNSEEVDSNSNANITKSNNDNSYNQQAQQNSSDTSSIQQENDINSTDTHAETINTKSENDAEFNNQARENSSETTSEQANNYSIDEQNKSNSNENKKASDKTWVDYGALLLADLVSGNSKKYSEDLETFKDYILKKIDIFGWFTDAEKETEKPKVTDKDIEDAKYDDGSYMDGDIDEAIAKYEKEQEILKEDSNKLNLDSVKAKINTITAKQANDISEASKQAESDAKKAQQEAEKAQQELEKYQEQLKDTTSNIETDRYFSLNNVIDDITSSLSKLKQQQDSMTNSDYQNSLLTEIELTKKKQEAIADLKNEYANEANELRNYLSKYSFTFDSNTGDFTNSQTRLLEIQNDINSAYYEASEAGVKEKKDNIEWVKQLQDKVERLSDIMHSEIPKCSEDWENLAISIKKSNTSMLEDLRNNIVDNLKKDIQNQQDEWEKSNEERKTAKQDALDKKIKKLQEQLKDMEDDSIDNQTKLDKLKKSLAMYNNDDSALGKKKRKELNEQITALEKQMAKDEINNEISKLEDKKQANEDAFSEEEKLMKNKFDNMLDERELYNKADQMLVNKNITEIQNLLLRQEENFKNVGSLLGENFSEGFLREIQNGLGALDNLKAMGNGTNLYNGSYNKPFYIASSDIGGYASGGRTPSNIDNGKLSVLHSNERILNEEDTKDFDLMTQIINGELKGFIEKSSVVFDNLNNILPIQPNIVYGANDLNKIANSISNVTNDSSKVEINNEFNITNKEQVQADNMPKSIEQLMKANINKYGKRMR